MVYLTFLINLYFFLNLQQDYPYFFHALIFGAKHGFVNFWVVFRPHSLIGD